MDSHLDTISSHYRRVALLIVPYGMILIVGHGAIPLGLCLLLGGFDDLSINWLGWIGIVLALIAPLISRRDSRTVAATIAAFFLIASAMILASHFAHLASGGVPDGSLILFYGFAAFFLLREWYLSFVYHTKA